MNHILKIDLLRQVHLVFLSILLLVCHQLYSCQESNLVPAMQDLTLPEKIGQLFVIATAADPSSVSIHKEAIKSEQEIVQLIQEQHIGGVILQGRSTPEEMVELINLLRRCNIGQKNHLLFCLDAEWGPDMRLSGLESIKIPFNMALGAISDDQLIYQTGKEIGRQLHRLGIHINLAPVLDVNSNPQNPIINRRSFGESPENVALIL